MQFMRPVMEFIVFMLFIVSAPVHKRETEYHKI